MVPMAYSTVDMPDSSTASAVIRATSTRNMVITNIFLSHTRPNCKTSPASPTTSGTMPTHRNAGKKHSPSGPAISTPARSAAAAAACAASCRTWTASSTMPSASAAPEAAERRANRSTASVCASWVPGGKSGGLDQAMLGSAPNASRSAARRNTRATAAARPQRWRPRPSTPPSPQPDTRPARQGWLRRLAGPRHPSALAAAPGVADARGAASRLAPVPPTGRHRATTPWPATPPPHSQHWPIGDPVRPQQPGAGQCQPDHQQPSAHASRQQKAQRPGADQLTKQHPEQRQDCQYGRTGPGTGHPR
ncbi:hypothetical protein MT3757 [Mycobacterium tuberculosis CDC1551]|uniref:Uncharacterized protein n=1 Tax=Mycobacterium tuberculosis (strain CDC 1551 / Oshkosh) TaxID=83331 RepID=Q8VIW2_MYCTO|nr:hypothetical protein MT3757 [Mycobacterium tuberculosis CDC1551]